MTRLVGEKLARQVVQRKDGARIVAFDSATLVDGFYHGSFPVGHDVIVNASYVGVFCARLIAPFKPLATIGVDCLIGKDGAGIAGLWYYEALGIPAAAADVMTAEMGNGLDLLQNGVISRVNSLAEDAGIVKGMSVAVAAERINRVPPNFAGVRTNRLIIKTSQLGRSIVCTDSIFFALPDDRESNVVCVGGHTGASVIGYLTELRPFGYICSDGGIGKDRSGLFALEPTARAGIPGASVSALTARVGDGRSTYYDGVISAANELAVAKGVKVGQTAVEAASLLLEN